MVDNNMTTLPATPSPPVTRATPRLPVFTVYVWATDGSLDYEETALEASRSHFIIKRTHLKSLQTEANEHTKSGA